MAKLSDEEISEKLAELDGWTREGEAIVKSYDRGDFTGSVNRVGDIRKMAEQL